MVPTRIKLEHFSVNVWCLELQTERSDCSVELGSSLRLPCPNNGLLLESL